MIKVKMIIKGFDFDDFGGKLTVSTWLAMVNLSRTHFVAVRNRLLGFSLKFELWYIGRVGRTTI